ncbi:hypothetical protein ACFL9S_11220 [Erwinia sp. AnSW2-5]|uniref:hypothetical protein n=1 Tax=Erwinia sp. AnSW2-5 TaxID=3367692 RepID=UPI00385FAD9E
MDKDSHNPPVDLQTEAPADPLPDSTDDAHPVTVDLEGWVLTPAQRSFIKSLLSEDDESDTDR